MTAFSKVTNRLHQKTSTIYQGFSRFKTGEEYYWVASYTAFINDRSFGAPGFLLFRFSFITSVLFIIARLVTEVILNSSLELDFVINNPF